MAETTISDPWSLPLMPLGTDDSGLQIYRHVGSGSAPTGEHTAEGRLILRPDLRTDTGPWASVLAVFAQDLAGVNVFRLAPLLVPTRIDVHLRDGIAGVDELLARGDVVRRSKNTIITSSRMYAGSTAGSPVAFGSITFATMGSTRDAPLDYARTQVTVPRDPPADLLSWLGATPRPDGRGYDLLHVTDALAEGIALGGTAAHVLHGGPLQVFAEAAATRVARSTSERAVRIEDFSTTFLAPARIPPFSAIADTVIATDRSVDVRVEIREEHDHGRLAAVSEARFALLD